MALAFLNPSRWYDAESRHIRFVGYDGMKSVPFSLDVQALRTPAGQDAPGEPELLSAFDRAWTSIQGVAREVYANSRQTSYALTSADFR